MYSTRRQQGMATRRPPRRARFGIFAAVAFACVARGAGAWTLDVPDSVVVSAANVRVADLVAGPVPAGPGAVVIAAGGRPGTAIEVTARAILRRLAMAGHAADVSLKGAERCRILFAGGAVPPDLLRRRLGDLLQPQVPPADPQAPPSWLELELPDVRVLVGDGWRVEWPQPRPLAPGRNLLTVAVHDGPRSQRLSVTAILHAYARVAVPVAPAPRGTVIDPQAVQWQWIDLAASPPGLVSDPGSLQDMRPVRDLPPGEPLARRDLEPQPLVRRGDLVDLVMRRGGVEAIVRVECRQDGVLDQAVSVRNPLNGKLLVARVAGAGLVKMGR